MAGGELNNIIDAFGDSLLTDLRKSLVAKGVTFGGGGESKLSAKMRFEITQSGDGLALNFIMPSYAYYLNKGRKPGPVSEDGRKSLANWVSRKGIVGKFQRENLQQMPFDKAVKSLVYLISRKLAAKGYPATHFIDDVLNDGRLKVFSSQLSEVMKRQIIITANQ